jgi:hemerythrin-like domain-containing protein
MRTEHAKSRETGLLLLEAANRWKAGDESARAEVGWHASEYSLIVRQHLDRLKNLIFPLLEQNLSHDDEHALGEKLNSMPIEVTPGGNPGKLTRLVETLEEELVDWD